MAEESQTTPNEFDAAWPIITLGRGCREDESKDAYAEECAAAARALSQMDWPSVAEAIRRLSANTENDGARFVADALIVLTRIVSGTGLAISIPHGTA
jgi:hypothetical protein